MNKDSNDSIQYEIVEHIGTIASRNNGWDKELNLIKWNHSETPKFDLRSWSPHHDHMARGITLYADEMRELVSLYQNWKHTETVAERKRAGKERKKGKKEVLQETESVTAGVEPGGLESADCDARGESSNSDERNVDVCIEASGLNVSDSSACSEEALPF